MRRQTEDRETAQAGNLAALERVNLLLDEGSFQEIDKFVVHQSRDAVEAGSLLSKRERIRVSTDDGDSRRD